MFKIQQEPKFEASVTIIGQGREQTLNLTFRAKPRSEYTKLLEALDYAKPDTAVDAVVALVEAWDADAPVSKESVAMLADHQPGAEWAIIHAYTEALAVAKKGN